MQHGKRYIALIIFTLLGSSAHAGPSVWADSHALQQKGEFGRAAEVLQQDPATRRDEYAQLRIAYLNYLGGHHNEAIHFYEQALKRNPDSIDARLGITLPLMVQQRWRQVKAQMKQLLRFAPWHYSAHIKLMIAEEALADWPALARHARSLTKAYPSDASSWVYLARANLWLGKKEQAKKAYREVLKRIPGHVEAAGYLAKY